MAQGGIDTNFGLNVQADVPVDLRKVIDTDADTSNVTYKPVGLRVRSDSYRQHIRVDWLKMGAWRQGVFCG